MVIIIVCTHLKFVEVDQSRKRGQRVVLHVEAAERRTRHLLEGKVRRKGERLTLLGYQMYLLGSSLLT